MSRARTHRSAWSFVLPLLVVVGLLAAGVVLPRLDVSVTPEAPDPVREPAAVAPPPGLRLPAVQAAPAPADPDPLDAVVLPGKVRSAVAPFLRGKGLGPRVAVSVGRVDRAAAAWSTGPATVTPASTMKLMTTTAALATLGPDHRFRTTVRRVPGSGVVTLVGGGDPFLASRPVTADVYPPRADVRTLARRAATSLVRAPGGAPARVRVRYDDTLFRGPRTAPDWEPGYVPGEVSEITALWVDEGRTGLGASDPSRAAAQAFARALSARGVRLQGPPRPAPAPRRAREVAAVASAPLSEIVAHVLDVSDNNGAEVLAHQVGRAVVGDGSFAGGVEAVPRVLRRLGVDLDGARVHDGSGLARNDRLPVAGLRGVLRLAASPGHPELRSVVTGLPVAGFTGSLTDRFTEGDPAALGLVRAKTGTLTGVHGLVGVAVDARGTPLSFVAVADRVPLRSEVGGARLDLLAAALAGCRCSRPPDARR